MFFFNKKTDNEHGEKEESEACNNTRGKVARYARGNVSLQKGEFVTKEEKQSRKRSLSQHNFK